MEFPNTVPLWGADKMVASLQVTVEEKKSGKKEFLALTSVMNLKRGKPRRLESGPKQVEVSVLNWSARGYSKLLKKRIEYRLSQDIKQPGSFVMAEQNSSDYPATMTFNAIFDVFIGNEKVISRLEGTAVAKGLIIIPPQGDDIFIVNKPFDYGGYRITAVACSGSQLLLSARQRIILKTGKKLGLAPKSLTMHV